MSSGPKFSVARGETTGAGLDGDDLRKFTALVADGGDEDGTTGGDPDYRALGELSEKFGPSDLRESDPKLLELLHANVLATGREDEYRAWRDFHSRLDGLASSAEDRTPNDWQDQDAQSKVEWLESREPGTIDVDGFDVNTDASEDEDRSIGGMYSDGGWSDPVGVLSGLSNEGGRKSHEQADFSKLLDDPDESIPSLPLTREQVRDVPLSCLPPDVRTAARAVRGGTDPSGEAEALIQRACLGEQEHRDRFDAKREQRRIEREHGISPFSTKRVGVGANYAGLPRTGRPPEKSMSGTDGSLDDVGVLGSLDARDRRQREAADDDDE